MLSESLFLGVSCESSRVCSCVCKVNKGIIVGCRCVLVPGRLQRRIWRTMALCFSTHLSHRGEVRGPDRRKITKEQTSLNLRGAMEGGRRGLKKKKKVQESGGRDGRREGHGGRQRG